MRLFTMVITKIFAVMLALFFATSALAQEKTEARAVSKPQQCAMTEMAQVMVNLNNTDVALAEAPAIFDKKIESITTLGKEAGVENLRIQSYNYNVYNNSGGGCCEGDCGEGSPGPYRYNGSVTFNVEPIAKAAGFADLLSKNGYSANLNVNAYSQCQ